MSIFFPNNAGTVRFNAGSATINGTGTLFKSYRAGSTISIPGIGSMQLAVDPTSDTVATGSVVWGGATTTFQAFEYHARNEEGVFSDTFVQLLNELRSGNLPAFAALNGAPGNLVPMFQGPGTLTLVPKTDLVSGAHYDIQVANIAARAAYNGQTAGFAVLVANSGDGRAAIFSKASNASADWSAAAYVTGPVADMPMVEAGTTTTLPPGANATFEIVPISGGYRLVPGLPAGEGFSAKGNYSGSAAYVKGDVVQNAGSSWIARIATIGNSPPSLPTVSNTSWQLLARAGNDGAGTVTTIGSGTGIAVDLTDPSVPVIGLEGEIASLEQAATFYGTLALEQAEDRAAGPVFGGTDGNGIFDGFNVLDYVDTAGATYLDTSLPGALRPGIFAPFSLATQTFGVNQAAYTNVNHRFRIAASQLTRSGGRIRLSLAGPTSGNAASISRLYIGHRATSGDAYDFDGTQVAARVGGELTFSIPPGVTAVTDWIDYALDETRDLIVAAHTYSGDLRCRAGISESYDWWTKDGPVESGETNVTGYTQSGAYDFAMVLNIEVEANRDFDARSSSLSLPQPPDWGTAMALVDLDAAVMNTNLIFSLSRNGAAFLDVPMTQLYIRPDGVAAYTSGKASLLSIGSGTNGKWRVRSVGNVRPVVHAIGTMFGVN